MFQLDVSQDKATCQPLVQKETKSTRMPAD